MFDTLIESISTTCNGFQDEDDVNEDDDDDCNFSEKEKSASSACKKCFGCCFHLLYERNFHISAYCNLFLIYEYLLTLYFSQVSCERSFSKLKIIKNRLRSSMNQDCLEAFMLMSVERELLDVVKFDRVFNALVSDSAELKRLLVV